MSFSSVPLRRWMRQEWTSSLILLRASLLAAGRKALNIAPFPCRAGACLNGVKLSLHGCKIAAWRGQGSR